jgi:hypothetical protein
MVNCEAPPKVRMANRLDREIRELGKALETCKNWKKPEIERTIEELKKVRKGL